MVINASAAITLLELRSENFFHVLSGIRTHDLCDAGAVLSQLSYQSHMRAVVYGLALYMGTFRLGPSTSSLFVNYLLVNYYLFGVFYLSKLLFSGFLQ